MDDESATGRAAQRAYDRSVRGEVDPQVDYDTFIQEVVIPNERWEEFVDHDLQRLRKIIDDGGDAGVEAAELCKSSLALALIYRSLRKCNTTYILEPQLIPCVHQYRKCKR